MEDNDLLIEYRTLAEKRDIVKNYLDGAGSICLKILKHHGLFPGKRNSDKIFYTVLISDSLEYLRIVETNHDMSINSIQITYCNGLSARISVRFFEKYVTYFYEQDDYERSSLNNGLGIDPRFKRYQLIELLDFIDSRVMKYGGIYEIVFFETIWGRSNPKKKYPLKIIGMDQITFVYSSRNDKPF